MTSKEKVVSALHALTSDEFLSSYLTDNLEVLVTEYFGGNDDNTDDDESVPSEDEEIRTFT